jgi:hypothetical protein
MTMKRPQSRRELCAENARRHQFSSAAELKAYIATLSPRARRFGRIRLEGPTRIAEVYERMELTANPARKLIFW